MIANYVLTTIYQMAFAAKGIVFENIYWQSLIYAVLSAIVGLIIGKIIITDKFNSILHWLKIGRTTNNNIWDDIIKPYTWLYVYMKDGTYYLVQYRYGEPFEREPIIVLTTYQKLDMDDEVLEDYSQNKGRAVVINTKDFDRIEVAYTTKKDTN